MSRIGDLGRLSRVQPDIGVPHEFEPGTGWAMGLPGHPRPVQVDWRPEPAEPAEPADLGHRVTALSAPFCGQVPF